MSTPVTSPEAHVPQAASMADQWREFFAFLRRPTLPERASGMNGASLRGSMRLLVLDFALMFVLLSALFIAIALGLDVPETALANIELTPWLVAAVVLGAPLAEELVFRSWLSGRPGHVFGLVTVLVVALIATPLAPLFVDTSDTGPLLFSVIVTAFGLVAGAILAIPIVYLFRNHGPMRWFAFAFPVILFLSALAFASVHLFNYEEDVSILLWLFVMPQFVLGLVVAYARVQFGLWSAILIHALHNGTIMALVLAFPEMA